MNRSERHLQNHNMTTVNLRIPLDTINDPRGLCENRAEDWRPVKLRLVKDLDHVMDLVQQAYDYNLT